MYVAHAQLPEHIRSAPRSMTLVIKTAGDPTLHVAPVRTAIRALDPNLPIAAIRTMQDVVDASIATPRLTGSLLGTFAGLALGLAALGIYSVLSYLVSLRRQEIGMVVKQGVAYALIGAAIGVIVAAATSRLLGTLLHGVTPLDAATFSIAPIVLIVVAGIASLLPGFRATRVDPMRAMRTE